MGGARILALALIVAGVLGLTYGGFTYTKGTSTTKLGPIEISVQDRERVNVPIWGGVAAIAAGAGLLLFSGKKG